MCLKTMRLLIFLCLLPLTLAAPYDDKLIDYNINTNKNAQSVLDYNTTRLNQTYTPSPQNWRALPVCTVLLDKWADGDPSNNHYFKTVYEYDWHETQLRFGGDLKGLRAKLDYLYGMDDGSPGHFHVWNPISKHDLAS